MTGGDGATTEAATCMACGRLLRDDESRRLRLGPVCRKRLYGLLAPRPRIVGTRTPDRHPNAVPHRAPDQLAFEIWDDQDDDEPDPFRARAITDVFTGSYL